MSRREFLRAAGILVGGLGLTACMSEGEEELSTTTPLPARESTSIPEPTLTPKPTEGPTPEPTPTVEPTQSLEQEIWSGTPHFAVQGEVGGKPLEFAERENLEEDLYWQLLRAMALFDLHRVDPPHYWFDYSESDKKWRYGNRAELSSTGLAALKRDLGTQEIQLFAKEPFSPETIEVIDKHAEQLREYIDSHDGVLHGFSFPANKQGDGTGGIRIKTSVDIDFKKGIILEFVRRGPRATEQNGELVGWYEYGAVSPYWGHTGGFGYTVNEKGQLIIGVYVPSFTKPEQVQLGYLLAFERLGRFGPYPGAGGTEAEDLVKLLVIDATLFIGNNSDKPHLFKTP